MKPELKVYHVVQEHVIDAPRAKVFKAITEEVGSWWSHSIQPDSKLHCEARVGGRFWEEFKAGGGMLFATVRWLKPGEEIQLEGSMAWDEPSSGLFGYTLEEKGGSTLIKFEHKFIGPVSETVAGSYTEGWKELLGTNLKEWVENGKKAER